MAPKFRVGMHVYCPFNVGGVRRQVLSLITTVEDCPLPPTSRYYMDEAWYEVVTMDWQEAQVIAEYLLSTPEEAVAKRLMR